MLTLVRQWRQKRVLMRPEAAFPYVSAAEGAQHPLIKPPRSTSCRHEKDCRHGCCRRNHSFLPLRKSESDAERCCGRDRRDSANHKKRMTSADVILL